MAKKKAVSETAVAAAVPYVDVQGEDWPDLCTCPSAPEKHYHLPEGAIVVWDPLPAGVTSVFDLP